MPTIYLSQEVDYVTMINYFSVAPEDQQEFAEIEVQEIEQYGDKMNAAIAASFHRSLVGSRVFNYAHWQSKEALEASQQTEEFKAHIKRMSHLNFTPDPRVYEVVEIFSSEPVVIDTQHDIIAVLTMIETQANLQKQIVEKLNIKNLLSSQDSIVSSHVLQSREGERIAVYTQCRDATIADSLSDQLTEIVELADHVETLPYKVLGSYK